MFFRLKLVLVRLDILQSPDTSLDNHKGKGYQPICKTFEFLFSTSNTIMTNIVTQKKGYY